MHDVLRAAVSEKYVCTCHTSHPSSLPPPPPPPPLPPPPHPPPPPPPPLSAAPLKHAWGCHPQIAISTTVISVPHKMAAKYPSDAAGLQVMGTPVPSRPPHSPAFLPITSILPIAAKGSAQGPASPVLSPESVSTLDKVTITCPAAEVHGDACRQQQ